MAAPFQFDHTAAFSPEDAAEVLRAIPTLPGVFALRGPLTPEGKESEPYLTRAADLRRRITRILAPPDSQSKRLNLRTRVAHIDYTVTGSEFESTLTLYHAAAAIFGLAQARRRLRLHTPFFLRFTAENPYPRVYSTNRLSKRALAHTYGPFPSRAAADRYCDAVLDLFKLRRCYEDLAPYPEHPGCVYGEMNKCLAPCNQACTPEGAAAYAAEAAAVERFFATRGESMIVALGLEREVASAAMEFERAAALHAQWHKVKAAQALCDELVQPIPRLRAVIVQKSTPSEIGCPIVCPEPVEGSDGPSSDVGILPPPANIPISIPTGIQTSIPTHPDRAAVFLLISGSLTGSLPLSTLGVRAVKEQTSVGSSLFAQPLMLQAIPLQESPTPNSVILSEDATPSVASQSKDPDAADLTDAARTTLSRSPVWTAAASAAPTLSPELRAANLIASLEREAPTDLATLSDHLSLLRRWYYRPEKQRTGEVFFPNLNGEWPIRRILNGAARMSLGEPAPIAETQRDLAQHNPEDAAQKPVKTKILHEGRPDVERTVHVAPKRYRSRKSDPLTIPAPTVENHE